MLNVLSRLRSRVFPTREEYILTTVLSQRTSSNGNPTSFKDSRGICKSTLELLSEGVLNEYESTAVSMLAQGRGPEMRSLLWCYNPKLNLQKLNKGNKGLVELFEEIRKGEAILRLRWTSDLRVRRLAKRVRVLIRDPSRRWWVVEVARKYYGAQPTYKRKPYAVTGCIQTLELSRITLAAQREVQQELGIEFPLEAFQLELISSVPHPNDEHESDAYTGILSVNQDYDVELVVDKSQIEKWIKEPPEINDTRVTVYAEVEDRGEKPPIGRQEEVRLSAKERAGFSEFIEINPD